MCQAAIASMTAIWRLQVRRLLFSTALATGTLAGLIAAPALAEDLIYHEGDTVADGLYDPGDGLWSSDGLIQNWWSDASSGRMSFAPGATAVFRDDIPGAAVTVSLVSPVVVSALRFESGDFRIWGPDQTITSLARGPLDSVRQIVAASGASGLINASLAGEFQVVVDGTLSLLTSGDAISQALVNAGGALTLSARGGDTITVAGGISNAGRLSVTGTTTLETAIANTGTLDLRTVTVAGSVTNAAAGAIEVSGNARVGQDGTVGLVNEGRIIAAVAGSTLTVDGTLQNQGRIDARGAALTVVADRLVLDAGTRVLGDVILRADQTTNRAVFDMAHMPTLGGQFDNEAGGTVTLAATVDGNEKIVTNAGLMVLSSSANLSRLDEVVNTGQVEIADGAQLTARVIKHRGSRFDSMGIITGLLRTSDAATLSGTVNGVVAIEGGTTRVVGALAVDDGTTAPDVAVLGGRLEFDAGSRLTAPLLRNDAVVDFMTGGELAGDLVNAGTIEGAGTITGNLVMSGAGTIGTGSVSVGGRLVNNLSAPVTIDRFAAISTGLIENRGTLTVDRAFGGALVNAAPGTMRITADVGGRVTNLGETVVEPVAALRLQDGLHVEAGTTRIRNLVEVARSSGDPADPTVRIGAAGALLINRGDLTVDGRLESAGVLGLGTGRSLTADVIALSGGTASLAGLVRGEIAVSAPATLTLDGATLEDRLVNEGLVQSASTPGSGPITLRSGLANNGAGARATIGSAGQLAAITGPVDNSGELTLFAEVDGSVGNAAGGRLALSGGRVTGGLTNAGTAAVDSAIAGAVQNSGTMSLSGSAGSLVNTGALTVEAARSLSLVDPLRNDGGTLRIAGSLAGGVANAAGARVELAGGMIAGRLTNRGTANLSGRVQDGIVNADGARLVVGGALTADLDNQSGGVVTLGSAGVLTGTLRNRDGGTVSGGGQVIGGLINDGTIRLSSDMNVTGNVTNNGLLTQSVNGSTFSVSGTLRQNGSITTGGFASMTVRADTIEISGTSSIGAGVQLHGNTQMTGDITYAENQTLFGNVTVGTVGRLTVAARVDGQGEVDVSNDGDTVVASGGALVGIDNFVNRDSTTVQSSGELSADLLVNANDATLVNRGTIRADVTNATGGTLQSTGRIIGSLDNSGTAAVSGHVAGDLTSAGDLAIGRNLTVSGSMTNTGTSAITGGTLQVRDLLNAQEMVLEDGAGLSGSGVIVSSGTLVAKAGSRIAGTLDNRGSADLAGTFVGAIENTGAIALSGHMSGTAIDSGGSLTLATGATARLSDGMTIRDGGTALLRAGALLEGDLANSGDTRVRGTIRGDVVNRNLLRFGGRIEGDVALQGGILGTMGDGVIEGRLTLAGGPVGATGAPGGLPSATATGSRLIVNAGHRLTVGGGTLNGAGSMVRVAGTLASDLTNAGVMDLGGTLDGSLTTRGTANLAGRITGDLRHEAGTMALTGNLAVGGTVKLHRDFTIARGRTLLARDSLVGGGSTLTVAGRLGGAVVNAGAIALVEGGQLSDGLVNRAGAVLNAAEGGRVAGGLVNQGLIDLRNDRVDSRLQVQGGLSGGGKYALDVNLDETDPAYGADRITVTGGAITGRLVLEFDVNRDPRGSVSSSILLVDADDSYGKGNDYSYEARNLPAATEKIIYGLSKTATGDLRLSSSANASIGGLSGNIVLTQSLIGSVVNRPTSPFVTGYSPGEDESPCAPGAWARATAGRADASGGSTTSTYKAESQISARYSGLQFGGDLACFDGRFGGWNMAFGVIGGVNDGSTEQPVYVLDMVDGQWVGTDRLGSINSADFRQLYAGVYATAVRDRLSADLQIRRERTTFNLTNKSMIAGSDGLGLTEAEFDSDATTISGSLSYAMPLSRQGWQIVPTAGFAFTNASTDPVKFDDGSRLFIHDSQRRIGFVGATVAHGKVLASGNEAVNYYATGSLYKDFADGTRSEFVTYNPDGSVKRREELVSDNLGVYGELSLGVSYTRVLDPGRAGKPKQFSASVRVDGRTGSSLDSYGVTAQMRLQF